MNWGAVRLLCRFSLIGLQQNPWEPLDFNELSQKRWACLFQAHTAGRYAPCLSPTLLANLAVRGLKNILRVSLCWKNGTRHLVLFICKVLEGGCLLSEPAERGFHSGVWEVSYLAAGNQRTVPSACLLHGFNQEAPPNGGRTPSRSMSWLGSAIKEFLEDQNSLFLHWNWCCQSSQYAESGPSHIYRQYRTRHTVGCQIWLNR